MAEKESIGRPTSNTRLYSRHFPIPKDEPMKKSSPQVARRPPSKYGRHVPIDDFSSPSPSTSSRRPTFGRHVPLDDNDTPPADSSSNSPTARLHSPLSEYPTPPTRSSTARFGRHVPVPDEAVPPAFKEGSSLVSTEDSSPSVRPKKSFFGSHLPTAAGDLSAQYEPKTSGSLFSKLSLADKSEESVRPKNIGLNFSRDSPAGKTSQSVGRKKAVVAPRQRTNAAEVALQGRDNSMGGRSSTDGQPNMSSAHPRDQTAGEMSAARQGASQLQTEGDHSTTNQEAPARSTINQEAPVFRSVCAYLLVAAIDFGTTYSGYAFSLLANPTKVFMRKSWGDSVKATGVKVPTSILLDPSGKVVAFGEQAESQYINNRQEHHLYRHFKMKLHKTQNIDSVSVTSTDGKNTHSALDLIQKSLAFFKDSLLEQLESAGHINITNADIQWVVTVPAIWSDISKALMRKAAFEAGLISKLESEQLILALEPEAAALYCRVMAGDTDYMKPVPINAKYMIMDMGGGTVDIAIHEALPNGYAKEVHYPTGGDWGGLKINDHLLHILADVIGEDFMKHFKKAQPCGWLSLQNLIEEKKSSVVENSDLAVGMPYILAAEYLKFKKEMIDDAFTKKPDDKLKLTNGLLVYSARTVKYVFDKCIEGSLALLKQLLNDDKTKDVKYLLMVGGFSKSPYMRDAVKKRYGGRLEIYGPEAKAEAVVQGAVLFGHNPGMVVSRCLGHTYGTSYYDTFTEYHDPAKKVKIGGKTYCKDRFNPFVVMGTPVGVNEVREFPYFPAHEQATSISFGVYASRVMDPMYVDESGVRLVETLRVKMPDTSKGDEREVKVKALLGKTEIRLTAQDTSILSGHVAQCSIQA